MSGAPGARVGQLGGLRLGVFEPAAGGSGASQALHALGAPASVEILRELPQLLKRAQAGEFDVLLVDAAQPVEGEALLAELRGGLPVVAVGRQLDGAAALAWFQRGAADCVRLDADAEGTLVAAVLEQAARARAGRARGQTQQRIRELEHAKAELQGQALQREKLASIGQLAAGVAHEINNPMGFIHANLAQMGEYVADLRQLWERVAELQAAALRGDADAARTAARALAESGEELDLGFVLADLAKAVRESQEGSERIRHIIRDLREFSYPDTDERVPADLNAALDTTAGIIWPMMKHLVKLEKRYGELPLVSCYPMQLKQVFMNLLVNAYQAIEERIGESRELGCIQLSTESEGDAVSVSVSDDGVGIDPAHRDRIFDPFFTTKKVGAGIGLGLSTSYGIVQRHGGSIRAEGAAGGGTTFRVRLPLAGGP